MSLTVCSTLVEGLGRGDVSKLSYQSTPLYFVTWCTELLLGTWLCHTLPFNEQPKDNVQCNMRAEPSFGTLLCHSPPQCNTHMKQGLMI